MNLHDLPKCQLPKEQHESRQRLHIAQGELLAESVRNWEFEKTHFYADLGTPCDYMKSHIPMAHMYKDLPFGAANTVERAGCVCFVSYYMMWDYANVRPQFTFEEWVKEVVEKGYRTWKFKNYPGTFTSPKVDIDEVLARFADKADLMCCATETQLLDKLGPAVGIGGSMYLLDNVIAEIRENSLCKPVEDTRLTSVSAILNGLEKWTYVPMRVNNGIYHDDPTMKEGHYVTLYGIEDQTALVWDSSIGKVRLPFERLMKAAVADKGLIAVWKIF